MPLKGLKSEAISDRTKRLLDLFANESYSSTGRLMLDLGISEGDTAAVLPLITKHASFNNNYLEGEAQSSVLIGDGLSDYLKINVGDTIVLIGQGYHGTSAAGKYEVAGIVKLPAPDIDNIIVYLPLEAARELFAAPGMATISSNKS